jgi:hypothetical protein
MSPCPREKCRVYPAGILNSAQVGSFLVELTISSARLLRVRTAQWRAPSTPVTYPILAAHYKIGP